MIPSDVDAVNSIIQKIHSQSQNKQFSFGIGDFENQHSLHDVMQNDSQPFITLKNHSKINLVVSESPKITHIHVDRILILFMVTKRELTFTHVFT